MLSNVEAPMKTHRTPQALSFSFWLLLFTWLASPAWAQKDPPGRVGRVASLQGGVSGFDAEAGKWKPAEANLPLAEGDRIATGPDGRAELQVGSTTLRLDKRTELEVLRLDDERMVLALKRGSLALRVRSADMAREVEINTQEARLQPLRAGHYRIDRLDDRTRVGSWRGDLRVVDEFGFSIATGEHAELWRDGRELRHVWGNPDDDAFAARALREDGLEDTRTASERFVSPEMTGVAELDRHGRWDRHPDYGPVWFPQQVAVGWAPYTQGRWAWVRPWGWTWVDRAPWGFAPFHYGRWTQWNGRWGWVPGAYVARPVYSPGLVVWTGTPTVGVTVKIGGGRYGPGVGWLPLSPRDRYAPVYRHTPRHTGRIDAPAWGPIGHPAFGGRPEGRADWRMQGRPDERRDLRPDGRREIPQPERRPERGPERGADPGADRRDDRQDARRDDRRDERQDGRREDSREERRDDRPRDRREGRPDDRRADVQFTGPMPQRAAPISPAPPLAAEVPAPRAAPVVPSAPAAAPANPLQPAAAPAGPPPRQQQAEEPRQSIQPVPRAVRPGQSENEHQK